jgi:S-formylglutathione hydrolase FrmB
MPDAFTRYGGSQYLDSTATGRYEEHLVGELVPWIDARHRTLAAREHRGIAGKSSGGYGALVHGMRHPDVFGAVACHSGDMVFEYCYLGDVPKLASALQAAGGLVPWLDAFERKLQKKHEDVTVLNMVAMAASYSPNPASPDLGIALPCDPATGAFRPGVWERWLAWDPWRMVEARADALRSLRLLYIDCGTRDEFHLHLGARLLTRRLRELGVPHEYEEFDDGHMNVSYRYDESLPRLGRALAGA